MCQNVLTYYLACALFRSYEDKNFVGKSGWEWVKNDENEQNFVGKSGWEWVRVAGVREIYWEWVRVGDSV